MIINTNMFCSVVFVKSNTLHLMKQLIALVDIFITTILFNLKNL